MMKKCVVISLSAGLVLLIGLSAYRLIGRFRSPAPAGDAVPMAEQAEAPAKAQSPEARYATLGLPLPDQPVAAFGDEKIPYRDFYRLVVTEYGQEILAEQVQDRLIQQELARRKVVVSDAEVEAYIKTIQNDLNQSGGPARTIAALLAEKKWSIEQFRREMKTNLGLEKMIRQDYHLPDSVRVPSEQIDRWLAASQKRARIRGPREGLPSGVVAIVNGQEILQAEIIKELSDRVPRSELEKLLDRLLDDRIVESLMRQYKVTVNDSDIDTKSMEAAIRKKTGMADVTLENYLSAGNKTLDDLRDQFRHSIGLRKVVSKQLTDAQLRAAFTEFQDAYTGKTVHAQHILALAADLDTMLPKDNQAFDRARVKIENVEQQIKNGASFEEMARKESDDSGTARKGGDLGFIRRLGDVCEELASMAFLLKVNEVSPPVRSGYGYHLVKVLEIHPGRPVKFEDVKEIVRKDVTVATCDRWLFNYKRGLRITTNLGTMGRATAAPPAHSKPSTGRRPSPAE